MNDSSACNTFLFLAIGLMIIFFTKIIVDYANYTEDIQPIPILTGEYGQPDGRDTLTGPYLDIQTMQIQKLQEENSRLKEAVKSVESKLRIQNLCGDMECGTVVRFIDGHAISSGRVVYYSRDEILQGEIGSYEIQTEAQYNDREYYGFERILPKSLMYNSKNELLKSIRGM